MTYDVFQFDGLILLLMGFACFGAFLFSLRILSTANRKHIVGDKGTQLLRTISKSQK